MMLIVVHHLVAILSNKKGRQGVPDSFSVFFYCKTLIGDRWSTFAFTVTSCPKETLLSVAKVTLLGISIFRKSMFG